MGFIVFILLVIGGVFALTEGYTAVGIAALVLGGLFLLFWIAIFSLAVFATRSVSTYSRRDRWF